MFTEKVNRLFKDLSNIVIKTRGFQVTITLISKDRLEPYKKIIHHTTKDISLTGAKIQTNTFLPVGSFLKIDLSLTDPARLISAFAKVRWVKSVYADELFEMGIEFVDTSLEIIKALKEHFEEAEK